MPKANYIRRGRVSRTHSQGRTNAEGASPPAPRQGRSTPPFPPCSEITARQQHCYDSHIKKGQAMHMKCFMQILLSTEQQFQMQSQV